MRVEILNQFRGGSVALLDRGSQSLLWTVNVPIGREPGDSLVEDPGNQTFISPRNSESQGKLTRQISQGANFRSKSGLDGCRFDSFSCRE